jgi:thiosulfate/3-mercaptopyruvate sulfurtransferase
MSYKDLQASELETFMQHEDVTIIDIRDAQTRSQGQLPNAQDASETVIGQLVMRRRYNPYVLVYCYHGNSSREMCQFLSQMGLSNVYNLVGGWAAIEGLQQQRPGLSEDHKSWLQGQGFEADNLNSRVEMGMSPLMMAALKGEHQLVGALLAAGADPRQVNDDEHHALWFACVHGDVDLVNKLIEAGSDINNRNVNGVTCAIYAASTGKLEVLQTLVAAGADLSIATHDGVSVLESASTLPVLKYLKPLIRQAG